MAPSAITDTSLLGRIGLSFGSMLGSATLFSLFLSLLFFRIEWVFNVMRVTLMFAVPVWLLYLPFVVAFKNAEGRRLWAILVSGFLIGPASLGSWGLVLLRNGGDPNVVWFGDPLLCGMGGIGAGMVFALIVGCLATSAYVLALTRFHRLSSTAPGRACRGAI